MPADFRTLLLEYASKAVSRSRSCTNEESTKLSLVLPFLALLGYDDRDPDEVAPEYGADFSEKYKNRVDFAVLKEGQPIICIECKSVGSKLKDDRGQLRSYFNASKTVKMGILTDGLKWEFYADSDSPNMMDETAFLFLDIAEIAKGKLEDSVIEGVESLQKESFDPENIGAEAKRKLIFQAILRKIRECADEAPEWFVRPVLNSAGLTHVRSKTIDEYRPAIQAAFKEFIDEKIIRRLDLPVRDSDKAPPPVENATIVEVVESPLEATETEMMVYRYVRRRLAFLIKDQALFDAIDDVGFQDYSGKFVVFYKGSRKGRLLEFWEGEDPAYWFRFPDGTETSTNDLPDIDAPLLAAFEAKVAAYKS